MKKEGRKEKNHQNNTRWKILVWVAVPVISEESSWSTDCKIISETLAHPPLPRLGNEEGKARNERRQGYRRLGSSFPRTQPLAFGLLEVFSWFKDSVESRTSRSPRLSNPIAEEYPPSRFSPFSRSNSIPFSPPLLLFPSSSVPQTRRSHRRRNHLSSPFRSLSSSFSRRGTVSSTRREKRNGDGKR